MPEDEFPCEDGAWDDLSRAGQLCGRPAKRFYATSSVTRAYCIRHSQKRALTPYEITREEDLVALVLKT